MITRKHFYLLSLCTVISFLSLGDAIALAPRTKTTAGPRNVNISPVRAFPPFDFLGFRTDLDVTPENMNGWTCETWDSSICSKFAVIGDGLKHITVYFYNKRLYNLDCDFSNTWYTSTSAAFEQKYGPATSVETRMAQNRFGATFSNTVHTWLFEGGGRLQLESIGDHIDSASFDFHSAANSPPTKKPEVNF